ncbi:Kinesin-like protein kifc2 [Phlyctochytrium bullatum]|nr:Kinesin-like protein kifc2 [Phlyctochytrium bullatum]
MGAGASREDDPFGSDFSIHSESSAKPKKKKKKSYWDENPSGDSTGSRASSARTRASVQEDPLASGRGPKDDTSQGTGVGDPYKERRASVTARYGNRLGGEELREEEEPRDDRRSVAGQRRGIPTVRVENSPSVSQRPSAATRLIQEEGVDSVGELPPSHGHGHGVPHAWHPRPQAQAHGAAETNSVHLHSKHHEDDGVDASIGELTGHAKAENAHRRVRFDTFIKADGTSISTFVEGDQTFYLDWESQQYHMLPEEWVKQGGYFLGEGLPDPVSEDRGLLAQLSVRGYQSLAGGSDSTLFLDTADMQHLHPKLLRHVADPRTLVFTDNRYRRVTTHIFPVMRMVRFAMDPETLRWEPMSLDWELEIPEVAAMVDLLQAQLHGGRKPKPSDTALSPVGTDFPNAIALDSLDEEGKAKSQQERRELLMALRERGYDVAHTLRDIEAKRFGLASTLDAIAERFFKETEEAAASAARAMGISNVMGYAAAASMGQNGSSSLGGGGHQPMAKVYRAPMYKAWEDTIASLKDRISHLETVIKDRDKDCREAQDREKRKDVELEQLKRKVAGIDEERAKWQASLVMAATNLDTANERAKRLEDELEVLKRGDFGRRHEGLIDIVSEKEDHVLRMRFVIGTLHQKLAKVTEDRRKERKRLMETLATLKRLKILPLIAHRNLQPLLERIRQAATDLSHLRSLHRVDRHTSLLARQALWTLRVGKPLTVLCRIRPDDRVRFAGRSPLSVMGDSEVAMTEIVGPPRKGANGRQRSVSMAPGQSSGWEVAAAAAPSAAKDDSALKSKKEKKPPKVFRFDKAFGPSATQKDLFAEIEPSIPAVLEGSSLCVIAFGQTGTGKTFTLQGSPATPGVQNLTIQRLFYMARERQEEKFAFTAMLLEIYNENVYDLFSNPEIPLSQQGNGMVTFKPAPAEPSFATADQLIAHVSRALAQRTLSSLSIQTRRAFTLNPTLPTAPNPNADAPTHNPRAMTAPNHGPGGGLSRSHIILSVGVRGVSGPRVHSGGGTVVALDAARVVFVDLAGSEAAWDAVDASTVVAAVAASRHQAAAAAAHRHGPGPVGSTMASVDEVAPVGGASAAGWAPSGVAAVVVGAGGGGAGNGGGGQTGGGIGIRRMLESASVERSFVSLQNLLRAAVAGVPFTLPVGRRPDEGLEDAEADEDEEERDVKGAAAATTAEKPPLAPAPGATSTSGRPPHLSLKLPAKQGRPTTAAAARSATSLHRRATVQTAGTSRFRNFVHVDSALARVLSGLGVGAGNGVGIGDGVAVDRTPARVAGKTVVIVHASPLEEHAVETARSLAFGVGVRDGVP